MAVTFDLRVQLVGPWNLKAEPLGEVSFSVSRISERVILLATAFSNSSGIAFLHKATFGGQDSTSTIPSL